MTIGSVMPVMSASWKASVPMRSLRTCPVMATSGDRVEVGVGDAGDQVGGAGAAGGGADADLAGGAGVAVGGVRRALLVAHQHVAQLLGVVEGVVERDGDAAREAEDDLAALVLEGGHEGLRAFHLLVGCHCSTAPFSAPETSLT